MDRSKRSTISRFDEGQTSSIQTKEKSSQKSKIKIKKYLKLNIIYFKENLRKNENGKISHLAPTISFDFNPKDGNTYIIGTEEGMIHRCSCSYNEQVLDTYEGHTGSVYRPDFQI